MNFSFDTLNGVFSTNVYLITYLNGASCNMTVVGKPSSEGWAIVECELWLARRELKLLVEGVNVLPEL